MMASVVFGSPEWLIPSAILSGFLAILIVWNYRRSQGPRWVKFTCAGLKLLGIVALGLCLLEPLLTGTRPQPGANVFVVLVDNSQSMQVRDGDSSEASRADWVKRLLEGNAAWRTRLGQDFDTRNYIFDTHLRGVKGFDGMGFDGRASSLHASLASVVKRYQGRPLAGILLLSDGNATDTAEIDWSTLPPIYPVLPSSSSTQKDIAVSRVTVSQTNFEAAPVTFQTEISTQGFKDQPVIAIVSNETGKEIERQEVKPSADREVLNFRFQIRPEKSGIGFYRIDARLKSELNGSISSEQTLANNSRLAVVDRAGGPYRVLYVSGRPNWEYKFLRRSLEEDSEVHLVGMIRVARREPKFDFRNPRSGTDNPLYKNFDNPNAETAERHDQPVLIRLGTQDATELRTGFPQASADLYKYHAIIIDDLEAEFFSPDQLALMRNFVSRRGGGFLMLGGPDSFTTGKYDRTPVGDLLPVYLDRASANTGTDDYRLLLTREGWLQPWVRTRKTEEDENRRLNSMNGFHTLSQVSRSKPGASVLAQVRDASGKEMPALVAQPFGKGRSSALLLGDFWRWGLRRDDARQDDFERSWRQMVRWLVADVPGRVDVQATPNADEALPTIDLTVRASDAEYLPLDNATVTLRITRPNKEELSLTAEPDPREAGQYIAKYVPREAGAFRAMATVTSPDGSPVGNREVGWCVQPQADEFARLEPNRELLENIAKRTQGEMVSAEKLSQFVSDLPSRNAPSMEAWVSPLWHRGWYFAFAITCLAAEWGLRRRYGLA
jgi:uncharacterized membrane protein